MPAPTPDHGVPIYHCSPLSDPPPPGHRRRSQDRFFGRPTPIEPKVGSQHWNETKEVGVMKQVRGPLSPSLALAAPTSGKTNPNPNPNPNPNLITLAWRKRRGLGTSPRITGSITGRFSR